MREVAMPRSSAREQSSYSDLILFLKRKILTDPANVDLTIGWGKLPSLSNGELNIGMDSYWDHSKTQAIYR